MEGKELTKKTSGVYCVYKNCKNRFYAKVKKDTKFFRFPRDEERNEEKNDKSTSTTIVKLLQQAKHFLNICGRTDLIKPGMKQAIQHYRICSLHFEPCMFNNPIEKNRLLPTAEPIKFVGPEEHRADVDLITCVDTTQDTTVDHNIPSTSQFKNIGDMEPPQKKIKIISDIKITGAVTSATRVPPPPLAPLEQPRASVTPPLLSPVETQTPTSLTATTPRKSKLRGVVKELTKENAALKDELRVALEKLNNPSEELFKSLCNKFLNPNFSKFVHAQIDLQNKSQQGKRYSNEFKQFALSLYFLSPNCYKQMQKTFSLPSYRSLCRYIENVQFSAGVNDMLFKMLKTKVDKFNTLDKFAVLCIDEMSVKSHLFYDYGRDIIIGLEDNGNVKSTKPASSATVFMARGISSSWKQPIAYMFSSTSYSAREMKEMLESIVTQLSSIGLNIICIVSDMGSNCLELAKLLGVDSNNSKIRVGDMDLFYYFDPPHMIKAVRNNLMKYDFYWDNYMASWSHIVQFYEKDVLTNNRCAPKLTKSHIEPTNFQKMRVKLATQVVSNTVSAALETYVSLDALPPEAIGTSIFLSKFDKLFDIFNSSNIFSEKDYKTAFSGKDYQLEFLKDMLSFLDKLIIRNSENKKVRLRFLQCWKITINSLIEIFNHLKSHGFQYILTRRINQDCIENFFGYIRQQHGNSVNPTPIQFVRAFKKSFVSDFIHTGDMNCEDDFSQFITAMSDFNVKENLPPCTIYIEKDTSFKLEFCNYNQLSFPEQNAFKYVCGYLIDRCLKIHTCQECVAFAHENNILDESNLFIHFKSYNRTTSQFGSLKTPHESFYEFIYNLENIFLENVEKFLLDKPGRNFFMMFSQVEFTHVCPNFPIEYMLKLYTRMRIYYLLKYTNRDFKTTPKKNRKLHILLNL